MKIFSGSLIAAGLACGVWLTGQALTQPIPPPRPSNPPPGMGGGFGGRFGGGFGGGGVEQDIPLVETYDKNGDGWLNTEERAAARQYMSTRLQGRRRGPRSAGRMQTDPGKQLSPADVASYPGRPLYDPDIVRTIFLEFENDDWEDELGAFHGTDVDVPATMIVDGKTYEGVGVHFRGNSSFSMVPPGLKRSLNLSVDFLNEDQRLYGYKTLNLLNSNNDPTFLRSVLYLEIARDYIPAPKANLVRVVINGENWGIYPNAQQFNKEFIEEWFDTRKGARWKVPGSPRGGGGLAYIGDDVAPYRRLYEIKSDDDEKDWARLVELCRVLNQTAPEELVDKLSPILDIDGALRFLALDKALINNDGYWTRASDYSIYLDQDSQFHIIPHDVNEGLREPEGGFGGGFGGGGNEGLALNPFTGANDPQKALLYRLLAVPELRTRYLGYLHDIAEKWLDWDRLGPLANQYGAMIADDVAIDTRKIYSTAEFDTGIEGGESNARRSYRGGPSGPAETSLKDFAEGRREYLLNQPDVAKAAVPR